jgi:hypothetical protein
MSTVDTSIYGPLISENQPFDVGKMLSLADMAQQMRQRQTQTQSQNALSQLLANPQSYDPNGTLNQNAQRNVNALNPEFGLKYRQQQIDVHFDQLQEKAMTDQALQRKLAFSGSIADATEKAREDTLKAGGTPQAAIEAATKVRNTMFDESGGIFSTDEIQKAKGGAYDPVMAQAMKRFAPGEIQEERLTQQDKIAQQNLSLKERQEAEKERADRAREDRILAMVSAKSTGKPPAGFEWDPNNPDTLRAIKGGPKDPDAIKPWAGREKVYTERILGSANQAATAIQNITELPVSSSTGLLGIGGHSGGSLFSASFGALKNKLSDQDVQDYNVMLAGVKRNLAAIETMGLAPQGALTESMGSLELRPGDSNTTKLRKLAEMRQIVEKGMDVPLADPAIPPEIKSLATKVVDTVTKAVPYTQADVTRLQREGQKDPDMTLEELIQKRGLGGNGSAASSSSAPRAPSSAARSDAGTAIKAVSSKAEYDRLPSGAKFSKPGDPPGQFRVKE